MGFGAQNFMKVLDEKVDTESEDYQNNYDSMMKVNNLLEEKVSEAMAISERERNKMKKSLKNSARERINGIVDRGSPFLEIAQLAGEDIGVPSGNIIAGIGQVCGQKCMIVANLFTNKGGAYFPITVKKHLRAQEIAEQNNLPCIYLVDSAGAFLP